MTAQEFFNKYNYRPIDYDNALGFQCMDLYHQYVSEVLPGYPHPSAKGAGYLIGLLPSSHYTWIANTPLAIPKTGDILLWGLKAGGGWGHVAIYAYGNLLNFTSFDQNWPVGSYCHYQGHNYFGDLKGWYRPKVLSLNDDQKEQQIREVLGQSISATEHIKKIEQIIHA